jgi:hypothetical protein
MAIVAHTVSGDDIRDFVIYAETANINYFLDVALEPDAAEEPGLVSYQRPASQRRRYPGDPNPYTVSGGTAVVLRDPGATNGTALPGRNFRLVERIDDGEGGMGEPGEERQFSFKGAISDLVTFVRSNSSKRLDLYSPRGRKYKINYETGEP